MFRITNSIFPSLSLYRRSEFLGCMSFPVKHILKKSVNGSFKLQPQSGLTNPIPPIPVLATTSTAPAATTASAMCDYSQSSEEITSLDDGGLGSTTTSTGGDQISLSKKALHQRDADENLFLRFLELDPPVEGVQRRQSASLSYKNTNGRTPFTISKKLTRTSEKGFGLSIVWTHPPRVEKVEPGLSADRAGITAGDYIVFVDKQNVVTMPESDVLNLIRAQGNTLSLEIFRRPASTKSNGLKARPLSMPAATTSHNTNAIATHLPTSHSEVYSSHPSVMASQPLPLLPLTPASTTVTQHSESTPSHHPQLQRQQPVTSNSTLATDTDDTSKQVTLPIQPLTAACSNASIETSKRRLHLPQVTFSKEVGQGVIV